MKRHFLLFIAVLASTASIEAQVSSSSTAKAYPIPHTTVPFRISDAGTKLPDITWGLDLAWFSESNLRRGAQFAGQDLIGIVRVPFQTINTGALNGALTQGQTDTLNIRINYVKKWAPKADINLNSDQRDGNSQQVTSWYRSSNSATQATRWSELIALYKRHVESKGLKVVSVSPFNEPDYSPWHQGSKADFNAICKKLREDDEYKDEFSNILLCGGNTLNNDEAAGWYNACKNYLDMGNTHQLAGTFDKFAAFYTLLANDGKIGMADELHNIMECMVASNYGLQYGIWWGTCEHTRSQWMKASRGTRLGYAENRSRWTAASVYRHPSTDIHPEGYVQGFGGTSERQANPTDFRFAALDHDVFFDGFGPTREYIMNLPGGSGYQNGQKNAEGLVNIQDGEDIMPYIANGSYRIVNRSSGYYLAPDGKLASGVNLIQQKTTENVGWNIRRVATDRGGDFSYITIRNATDTLYTPDLKNWSLEDQGEVICYPNRNPGDNELWFLEYASDGYYYIKSKHSGYCLDLNGYGTLVQSPCSGAQTQQWRLIAATTLFNKVAPQTPVNLTATAQNSSIRLDWQMSKREFDIKDFIILRSSDQQTWNTIYQMQVDKRVTADSAYIYIDNTVQPSTKYYYKVRTRDLSLNRSDYSNIASETATGEAGLIAQYLFEGTLNDITANGNHAAALITPSYSTTAKMEGEQGLILNSGQYLALPATIANSDELTICAWVRWNGGSSQQWSRIIDFGSDTDHYFFITPQSGSGPRFAIKNGSTERIIGLGSSFPANKWTHLAITFSQDAIKIYINGAQKGTSTTISDRPSDFTPIFNYIGRSQFRDDPFFNGYIDDLRFYNYALSAETINAISGQTDAVESAEAAAAGEDSPAFDLSGRRIKGNQQTIKISRGKKVLLTK
ncbi:MAG: RICIN domain-containing protein [Bacteroidaceae bacterium]|nr:RICIN domain-containing protein [Bacteroidaceae bacterium]